jgi:uncharacterized protein (TIGR02145 family)
MELKTFFNYFTISFVIISMLASGCKKDNQDATSVTDIDGNVYPVIKIGNQVWMAENLKVTKYQNGDPVTLVTSKSDWANLNTEGYCIYNNADSSGAYGMLYNWNAVTDERNIAPKGWHVPDSAEFQTLVDYLGGKSIAGGEMKETGFKHWTTPNMGATNTSGYNAIPGGIRDLNGNFQYIGLSANFWCSDEYSPGRPNFLYLINTDAKAVCSNYNGRAGLSVRCIKD